MIGEGIIVPFFAAPHFNFRLPRSSRLPQFMIKNVIKRSSLVDRSSFIFSGCRDRIGYRNQQQFWPENMMPRLTKCGSRRAPRQVKFRLPHRREKGTIIPSRMIVASVPENRRHTLCLSFVIKNFTWQKHLSSKENKSVWNENDEASGEKLCPE